MMPYYIIVVGRNREELIQHVNAAIANGYWPQGSPQNQDTSRRGEWWQAMVLRNKPT